MSQLVTGDTSTVQKDGILIFGHPNLVIYKSLNISALKNKITSAGHMFNSVVFSCRNSHTSYSRMIQLHSSSLAQHVTVDEI
jgi:hypothetical protein